MSVVIVAMLALAATATGPDTRFAISIVIGLPSFVLTIISRRQLGEAFAVTPNAKALVTTGFYARIQHPMYLFLDLFLLCVIVAINAPAMLLAWIVLVIVQAIQSQREEKILSTAFGAQYDAYKDRTWI